MAVSRLGRDLLGLIEQAHRVVVEPRCRLRARTRDGGKLGEQRVDALHGARGIAAGALDQARGHALIVFEQRSEEHTSELQSLMSISYAGFCLKQKNKHTTIDLNYPLETHPNIP